MANMHSDELNALFEPGSVAGIEPDILAELESIMHLHSLPPQELFYKWESYSMKMGTDDLKMNMENARALKKNIQENYEREAKSKTHIRNPDKRGATPRNISSNNDVFGMLDGLVPNTPRPGSIQKLSGSGSNKRKIGSLETSSTTRMRAAPASSPTEFTRTQQQTAVTGPNETSVAYHDRPNAGQILEVLNDHLQTSEPPIAPCGEPRIKIAANSDAKKLSYKPMAMKLSEASEILDDRIDDFIQIVQKKHELEDSDFGSAARQSINEIIAVGRIACDSSDGKLNPDSLVLETSRRMGAGLRVPLKVDKVSGYQFFPGQIVALKGINVAGETFAVNEILELPLLPVAASAPSVLEAHLRRLHGSPDAMDSDSPPPPLNILIGSGPFTADDNLDYEPLHTLCGHAADSYADALILCGPFLDIDHPLIASGDFDLPDEALAEPDTATLTTAFKYFVAPIFQRLLSANPHMTVVLVPSVRDAISHHVSWPQEPFPRKELGLPKGVRVVGNPMIFSLNEIMMGISSQDVLYSLRQEELTGGKLRDPSLLSRLPRYMIEQRHFFPLLPPMDRAKLPRSGTAEGLATGAMLDLSYLKLGEMLNVRPDIMITPSALPPFAKVVESVLVINPGYLSRRKAAGTYAKLTANPVRLTVAEQTQEQILPHRLFERARVDLVKI